MNKGVLEQLKLKYFLKDENGELLETTPEEMFARVAKAVASIEGTEEERQYWEAEFYELMKSLTFLPNTPCLMNAGTPYGSLAACFVVDIEDSRDSIGKALVDGMEIFAHGGGIGFPFSKLRPQGDMVLSTKGEASGPVSFAEMYDAMVNTIKQGGRRRGAAMGTLRVDHPDVFQFISIKRDKGKLTNFNLSVLITDEFMDAVRSHDEQFWASDPKTGEKRGFNRPDGTKGPINPQDLMDLIVTGGWSDGEPGVYFIDNATRENPFPYEDEELRLLGPNPCGEATLRGYESCVLGSINLTKFVTKDKMFDFGALMEAVPKAIRFLDNVIEVSVPPIDLIKEKSLETRKIGLGIMGLHDTLLMMGLPYSISKDPATAEAVRTIMAAIRSTAIKASEDLASERGPFPMWERSTLTGIRFKPRRNACVMSVAPTGTLARIADVSFGMEPVPHFRAINNLVDVQYESVHWLARPYLEKGEELPPWFESAAEISPSDHLEMQAIIQGFVDQAVSKTILLPNSAKKEDIQDLYVRAWELGIKGFTVYRDGSRADQPIKSATSQVEPPSVRMNYHEERERTVSLYGPSYKIKTPEGNVYVDIHHNTNEEVCEVMLQLGDGFTDTEKGLANWAARILSKALQHGMDYYEVVKQGASTEFEHKSRAYPGRVFWFGTNGKQKAYRSIPEVVSDLIIQEVNRIAFDDDIEPKELLALGSEVLCPRCNSVLEYVEGCRTCMACGFSKCG